MIASPPLSVRSPERSRIVAVYCLLAALPTLGLLFSVAGRGFAVVEWPEPVNGVSADDELAAVGVRTIDSVDDWNRVGMRGTRILFVDCDWNLDVAVFRQTVADYAAQAGSRVDLQIVRVRIDADNTKTALFDRVCQLWRENGIHPGGMKNFGGAGRVVWLVDGHVLDYAWGHDIASVKDFQRRTIRAFHDAVSDDPL